MKMDVLVERASKIGLKSFVTKYGELRLLINDVEITANTNESLNFILEEERRQKRLQPKVRRLSILVNEIKPKVYSYTFKTLARYSSQDRLTSKELNTYAENQELAYEEIKANADRVFYEYKDLRLVKVTEIPKYKISTDELVKQPEIIWEEIKQLRHKKKPERKEN